METAPLLGRARPWRSRRVAAIAATACSLAALWLGRGAVAPVAPRAAAALSASSSAAAATPVSATMEVLVNGGLTMPLFASLRVVLRDMPTNASTIAVEYFPEERNATGLPSLWSAATTVLSGANANATAGVGEAVVSVLRLRPRTRYLARLFVLDAATGRREQKAWVRWRSPSSGVPRFDDGPLASLEPTSTPPTWQMVTFVYEATVKLRGGATDAADAADAAGANATATLADEVASSTDVPDADAPADADGQDASGVSANRGKDAATFSGLVAIDAEGFVVWYYHLQITGWDFLPASEGYNLVVLSGQLQRPKSWEDADGRVWNYNSQLQEVTPFGGLRRQLVRGCTGAAANYNQLTHELQVDRSSADLSVLVGTSSVRAYPNTTLPWTGGRTLRHAHVDALLGSGVARWRRAAGAADGDDGDGGDDGASGGVVEPVLDLFGVAAPDSSPPAEPAVSSWTWVDAGCSGETAGGRAFVDYHHLSSASVGPDGNLVVSSRNLDVVWSFAADGSTLEWMLSDKLGCASLATRGCLGFARPGDAFSAPHSVRQLNATSLLVLDDGNNREGCSHATGYAGCFSRAALYDLDFGAGLARLAWQFEAPLALPGDAEQYSRADWRNAMTHDEYNFDGGSVHALAGGTVLTAFTATYPTRASNRNASAYIWEVDPRAPVR